MHHFGPQSDLILERFSQNPGPDPETGLGMAELWYCLEHEMICTAMDFFERRTAKLYFDPGSTDLLLNPVIQGMATYFNWDGARMESEREAVKRALEKACRFD